jgi:arsenate reductase
MALKVYCYDKCGTCRKALKYLDENKIAYSTVPIRERPPSKTALRKMRPVQ